MFLYLTALGVFFSPLIHPVFFKSMQLKVSAISKGKVRFLNLRGNFVLKTSTPPSLLSTSVRFWRTQATLLFRNPKGHAGEF